MFVICILQHGESAGIMEGLLDFYLGVTPRLCK